MCVSELMHVSGSSCWFCLSFLQVSIFRLRLCNGGSRPSLFLTSRKAKTRCAPVASYLSVQLCVCVCVCVTRLCLPLCEAVCVCVTRLCLPLCEAVCVCVCVCVCVTTLCLPLCAAVCY